MADYVQWDSVPKDSGNTGEKSDFLRLEGGRTYKIRPIFNPIKFFKYFHKNNGRLRTAICSKPEVCPVRDRHPELKKPSLRYVAYVIDREDNKVKILEAPQSVFRPIGSSLEATGKNPGSSKDGSDWQIKVVGKGLNTTYEVAWAGATPLSEAEKEMIKEALDGDTKKLKKIYKTDTSEEIEEKLFGEDKPKESSSEDSFTAPAAAPAAPAASSPEPAADGDDDFDQNW
jgi:hypothetical protein